jgi:hypothetical protein
MLSRVCPKPVLLPESFFPFGVYYDQISPGFFIQFLSPLFYHTDPDAAHAIRIISSSFSQYKR